MNSSSKAVLVITALLAIGCLFSGCRKRDPVALVHGKVTYKNKPVEKGTVVFFPKVGQVGYGNIQPDGSYKLTNQLKEEGIPPGQYIATISLELDRSTLGQAEPPVPVRFSSRNSSPLHYELPAGDNEININLDSAALPAPATK